MSVRQKHAGFRKRQRGDLVSLRVATPSDDAVHTVPSLEVLVTAAMEAARLGIELTKAKARIAK